MKTLVFFFEFGTCVSILLLKQSIDLVSSVNRVVEYPGAGLGRLRTINFELNGAT